MKTEIVRFIPRDTQHTNALLDAVAAPHPLSAKRRSLWLRTSLTILQGIGLAVGIALLFGLIWGIAKDVTAFSPH